MKFRSDLEFLILSVLTTEPKHGYEIAKSIRELSDDAFKYGEAQIYPALRKLEENSSVVADWQIQEGKPNRRIYAITDQGRELLETQQQEWVSFQEKVNRFVLIKSGANS